MPKSRIRRKVRRPRRPGKSGDPRRYLRTDDSDQREIVTLSPKTWVQDFEQLLTEDDLDEMWCGATAEAEGDPVRALHHYQCAPYVLGSMRLHYLHELIDLGADAPGWMYSRWAVHQAYRWMLTEHDPRIRTAVVDSIASAYLDVDLDLLSERELRELGTRIAGTDWICQQLAAFDLGGLADFLDLKAAPALVDRCDQVRAWASVPMAGYRIDSVRRDRLVLTHLESGEGREALNLGALAGHGPGRHVIGRLVPVDVAPGLMFESRPLDVPAAVAGALTPSVAAEFPSWLGPVATACQQGRMPQHFSSRRMTPLSSDLAPEGLAERVGQDAENGVAVCGMALTAVQVAGAHGAEPVAPHVQALLMDSGVFAAARRELVDQQYTEAWRLLAEHVPEPVRSRCRELAALCRSEPA